MTHDTNSKRAPSRRRALRFVCVLLAAAPIAFAFPAQAAEGGEFSLRPVRPAGTSARERSYVVRSVGRGETFTDTLEAVNLTGKPLDLIVEAVDATVNNDGAFTPLASSQRSETGGWITLSTTSVSVPAHGTTPVGVRVRVPSDAARGDHLAAIAIRKANPPTGPGIQMIERVAVRVYLTVKGGVATRNFSVSNFHFDGTAKKPGFSADVTNTGTLIVEPLGTVSVKQGSLGLTTDLPVLGTVPPGETRSLRFGVKGPLDPGTYKAELTLRPVQGGFERDARTTFDLTTAVPAAAGSTPAGGRDKGDGSSSSNAPLKIITGILPLLTGGFLFVLWKRRRRDDEQMPRAPIAPAPPAASVPRVHTARAKDRTPRAPGQRAKTMRKSARDNA